MRLIPCTCRVLLALFVSAGCSPQGPEQAETRDAESLPQRIDHILSSAFPQNGPGAAAIVARDGEVVFRGGYGLADLELGVPIEPGMIFRVASITKEFTAVLVMQLVEEGVLSLDDELTNFLPDYPVLGHRVTVRHLLSHTSGIKTFQRIPGFQDHVREDHTLEETIAIFANEPFEFPPGERYSYSSSGYILLGAILEQATGTTYEQLLRERIFDVVGLASAYLSSHDRIIPGRVSGYTAREGIVYNSPIVSMTIAFSSGGLMMSVDDLANWDEALYGTQLLGEPSKEEMWSPHVLNSGQTTEYGLGWMVTSFLGHRVLMHDGSLDGFLSAAMRLPDDHIFVAVLTNSDSPQTGPNAVAREILAVLLGIPEKQAIAMSQAELDRYAGTYVRRNNRVWSVIAEDGRLFIAPNETTRLEIEPETDTSFFFLDRSNRFNTVTFDLDEEGAVTGLVLTLHTGDQIRARREGATANR
ncbi:MAG: serine hydrolase [Gemmatimonadales bacterium]|nr:serine hydrolase [Gemmatimonadales bacterium]NIN10681.1 serine hydrolase [Gemmatimonadales bacterium]NIN49009.1 serine hydrolase [Gemmatimonadales bacterium]NIP06473.1 serine hydrolase [Gemmatimonadales bacterium]NIQ98818.1 serine hydrolase [Gemmatimonadales bacterium]